MEILWFVAGAVIGGAVAWVAAAGRSQGAEKALEEVRRQADQMKEDARRDFANLRQSLDQEQQARVRAETQWQEAMKNVEEQKRLLEDSRQRLSETFDALSSRALDASTQKFLALADQKLRAVVNEAQGDLGKREQAIKGLVQPLHEVLQRYEEQLRGMEKRRDETFGGLEQELKRLNQQVPQLQQETAHLVNAFKNSQVRGQLGEVTLIRVLERAGLAEHLVTEYQVAAKGEAGDSRFDAVLALPGDRRLIIDAKNVGTAYWEALNATDEAARTEAKRRHARDLRSRMQDLASKQYWQKLAGSLDFVVMFIPSDALLTTALEVDPDLWQKASDQRVVLVTPFTLIALIQVVQMAWRQEQMAQNTRQIGELAKELYDRLVVFTEHFVRVDEGLRKADKAYREAVGSFDRRVLPAARRMKELGVPSAKELPPLPAGPVEMEVLAGGAEATVPPVA